MLSFFEKGIALLVGVGNYTYAELSDLPTAVADVSEIARVLANPNICAYKTSNIRLLTDTDATSSNIRKELDNLCQSCDQESTVLIYFSGHGGVVRKNKEREFFLCPSNFQFEFLDDSGISGKELSDIVEKLIASKVLVVLDACHSGGVINLKTDKYNMKSELPDGFLDKLASGSGKVAIASSKQNQYSYVRKEGDFGLFSYYFIKGLMGEASRNDGYIRVLDLIHYVTDAVPKDRPNQQPIYSVRNADSNFPIALCKSTKETNEKLPVGEIRKDLVINKIREEIIRDPIKGTKTLSDYLRQYTNYSEYAIQIDLKRAELLDLRNQTSLFGSSNEDQKRINMIVFFVLELCSRIETFLNEEKK